MEMDESRDALATLTEISPLTSTQATEPFSPGLKQLSDVDFALTFSQSVKISQTKLINALNYIHFKNEFLWARIRGKLVPEALLVKIHPGPCRKDVVHCQLAEGIPINLMHYQVEHLIIEDGKSALVIPVTVQAVTPDSISVLLPAHGHRLGTRKVRRLMGQQLVCELSQGTVHVQAYLYDFSIAGFRIGRDTVGEDPPGLDTRESVKVCMRKDGATVFAGTCRILRQEIKDGHQVLILKPLSERGQSGPPFRRKRIRNPRLCLVPTPKAVFHHPLSNHHVTFELDDITIFGFSLKEHIDDAVLLPGMIIRDLTLLFGGDTECICTAQVLHTRRKGDSIHVGLSIRDMDVNTGMRIYDIVTNALDRHANSRQIEDMDALWEIFFETGFIYPEKYEYLSRVRDAFKETYRRLYQSGKDIFFHFTYQQNGRIFGHISFIRAYQHLWMIHHFAARPMHGQRRIGLEVYKHIFNLYDAARRFPSANLDYVMCYFRPTSSFNMYFQGGFCRMLNNPHVCSMDLFTYHYLPVTDAQTLPPGWSLEEGLGKADLSALRAYYAEQSGGLFLDALGIGKQYPDEPPLEEYYARSGLFRRTGIYTLKHTGRIKALCIVDQSDIGLNLSELLNCIKVIVIDPEELPWEVLAAGISHLAGAYQTDQIPVMIYPHTYAADAGLACDRSYHVWILDSRYADIYINHMKKKIRIPPLKLIFRAMLKGMQPKKG